jgi:hypothetical protein
MLAASSLSKEHPVLIVWVCSSIDIETMEMRKASTTAKI